MWTNRIVNFGVTLFEPEVLPKMTRTTGRSNPSTRMRLVSPNCSEEGRSMPPMEQRVLVFNASRFLTQGIQRACRLLFAVTATQKGLAAAVGASYQVTSSLSQYSSLIVTSPGVTHGAQPASTRSATTSVVCGGAAS